MSLDMDKLGPQLESFDRLRGGGVNRGLTAVGPSYATSPSKQSIGDKRNFISYVSSLT